MNIMVIIVISTLKKYASQSGAGIHSLLTSIRDNDVRKDRKMQETSG